MNFETPYLLLLLLPLVLLWRLRASRAASSVEMRRLPLLVFSIACLFFALARPYWSTTTEKRIVKDADFIILLDVSQSMFCPDERGLRRIDEARNFLHQLLPEFSGSSMALIYFAGDAQIGCPLTDDQAAIRLFLDSVAPAMTGQPGTNPDQLQQTLSGFLDAAKSSPIHNPRKQIALLFSDGEFSIPIDGFGKWIKKQTNLSVFTFVCGKGRVPVPNFQLTGPYPGAFSVAAPKNLEALSTGPTYNLAGGTPLPVGDVTTKVKDEVAGGKQIPLYEYVPFLILSFCFLIGYQIYPVLAQMKGRPEVGISIAATVLLLTTLSMTLQEKSSLFQKAMEDLHRREYAKALEKLERLRKEGGSEDLDVATGNAYFLQKKYDEAISFYEHALQRNPGNLAARWNWEVALKRQQSPQNNPPQLPPPKHRPAPQEIPRETQALLKYFDQKEKEQMQLTNSVNAHTERFAW